MTPKQRRILIFLGLKVGEILGIALFFTLIIVLPNLLPPVPSWGKALILGVIGAFGVIVAIEVNWEKAGHLERRWRERKRRS